LASGVIEYKNIVIPAENLAERLRHYDEKVSTVEIFFLFPGKSAVNKK
jgi:hypothetical protein